MVPGGYRFCRAVYGEVAHEYEVKLSRQRRASAFGGAQGNGGKGKTRGGVKRTPTKAMWEGEATGG